MKHHNMRARYEAAETLLTKHTRTAVLNGNPKIHWNADGTAFQYERQERSGSEVTSVLAEVNGMDGTRKMIQKAEKAGQAANAGSASGCSEERAVTMSPDGAYHLSYDRHNLILTEQKTGEQSQLTFDGEPDLEYGCYIDIYSQITVKRQGYQEHPQVLWSPDGTRFITYRADRRTTKKLPLIASYSDGLHDLRPELYEYPCPFVTDSDEEIPHYSLYIGSLADKTLVKADAPDFLYPVFTSPEKSTVKWMEDSRHFYFTWIARGYQEACLYLGDAQNGSYHVVIRETTEQFFNLGAFGLLDGYGSYLFSNFITSDRAYAFWQSERNGFAHLYRYRLTENESVCEGDLFDASEKELIVQKLIRVDEQDKQIYFMANNVPDCSDPMYYQLYRIGFDGSGLTRLTPEDAVHQVSMGSQSFVDTYSRVDLPPVTVLRKLDGTLICELEKADISNLLKDRKSVV